MAWIRGIVAQHLARSGVWRGPLPTDPNALVDVAVVAEHLRVLEAQIGQAGVADLARDYVALWGRTFKSLGRHLRGRPERALAVWAAEVYPFLRGDRLAARIEDSGPGHARVVMAGGLPEPYLAALVEAFVGLSGAKATCTLEGDTAHVTWRLGGLDLASRWVHLLASLRVPLVVSAVLSAATGLAMSWHLGHWDVVRALLVLIGAISAQAAVNALHDLGRPSPGPLGPVRASVRMMRWTVRIGYGVAALAGLVLAIDAPWVLGMAAVGLVVSALFGKFRNHGLGPILAGLTYGPLLPLGVLVAMGASPWQAPWLVLSTFPLGFLAAALLYVDDLADRPLDEAGGQRTLIVRMPPRSRFVGYALLLMGGVFWSLVQTLASPRLWIASAALMVGAAAALLDVHRNLDDPRHLAPARFGTFMLLVATGLTTVVAILEDA